ncbi:hypothetical protein Lal_00027721 [Lupinus albus]|nr:hypothetical protein Lal_00027721 [Lupinus albus]
MNLQEQDILRLLLLVNLSEFHKHQAKPSTPLHTTQNQVHVSSFLLSTTLLFAPSAVSLNNNAQWMVQFHAHQS